MTEEERMSDYMNLFWRTQASAERRGRSVAAAEGAGVKAVIDKVRAEYD